ncbi:MAG: D-hexose-6-phosphate mutarotase [Lentisphaeria bacterium]|nr:D-hexose-6-phosphate mutarotase [Lentisphaeria bacterium]
MNPQDTLLDLNEKFQLPSLTFGFWQDSSLPTAYVANRFCRGVVSLFGAHILSYLPDGRDEVLWISQKSHLEAPKAIRGGIPLCWPWFGGDPAPTHGVARIQFWTLTAAEQQPDGSDTLTFELTVSDPHPLKAVMSVNFGAKLTVSLTTENLGSTEFVLGDAIHTYFHVGEISQTVIHGLGGAVAENRVDNTEFTAQEAFGFEAETDNIYHSEAAVTIEDPVLKRKILVEKENSRTTVVWNPWIAKSQRMADFGDEEYHTMVCVEAANCSVGRIPLAPGAKHTLIQKISLVS